MKPALLLIDLQRDFLEARCLEPAAGTVVSAASRLLEACRSRRIPVLHVWTTVHRDPDDRMPHWRVSGKWQCVEGTRGHAPPGVLAPAAGERVIHKQFFSGFGSAGLESGLKELGCDALILAGVHLHGCVRATALDAYERGFSVWIADDAVASDDPLHAAITRRYLACRTAHFEMVSQLLTRLESSSGFEDRRPDGLEYFTHFSPVKNAHVLWQTAKDDASAVRQAATAARFAGSSWRKFAPQDRASILRRWAANLLEEHEVLAHQIVTDIGKPVTMARAEIRRSADLLHAVAAWADLPLEAASSSTARYRYEPLGVVAIITPYNNPVAIPVGKIGPALRYGNTVLWKPSPVASMIAGRVLELGLKAGLPEDVLRLCMGDQSTSMRLAEGKNVDGLTVSGSARAGYALQEQCARRHIPFQAELGGNNAAIVWDDAALPSAAALVAEGAFGMAGQRCTANRRVIVAEACFEVFLRELEQATGRLAWGDPQNPATVVGPLISVAKRDDIQALIQRAADGGLSQRVPHRAQADYAELLAGGAFYPPTIVVAEDPAHEIVQEESFGPVLVVQRAASFDQAMAVCNGVRQGLVAALFSISPDRQEQFLRETRAGVLKLNRATADADAASPLGGWKASGVGPAEHGPSDREFFCRVQTIYRG